MKEELEVKKFKFPSFEEWKNGYEWSQGIGCFTCRVATVAWGYNGNTKNTWQIAISISSNPLNIYSPKLFNNSIKCDVDDENTLRQWYEEIVVKANEAWEQYILGVYFGNND